MKKIPVYHGSHPILGCLPDLQRNTLDLLTQAHQSGGDAVCMRFLYLHCYSFIHPDQLKHIFQDNPSNYDRDTRGYKIIQTVLGQGILTSKGETWRRQRRSAQEEMRQERVEEMTNTITEMLEGVLEDWEEFSDIHINMHMAMFAFYSFDRACFGLGVERWKVKEIIEKQDFMSAYLSERARTAVYAPPWIPTKENRSFLAVKKEVVPFFQGIIDAHQSTYKEEKSLLGRMMRDNEQADGTLDKKMIEEELYAFFALGNETVGLTLQWLWYTLGQDQERLHRLVEEVDTVLGGKSPVLKDFEKMPFLDAVLKEIMRLYPPVFQIARRSMGEDCVDGYRVRKNHPIVICLYLIHRHKDFWDQPDTFYPERFLERDVKDRHTFSFMPFGRGPNQCPGFSLAMAEMKCIVTMILQRHIPVSVTPQQTKVKTLFTLFAQDPIYIKWKKRI